MQHSTGSNQQQLNKRIMHDQSDNITETRGSLEQEPTVWHKFKSFVCPCLITSAKSSHGTPSITSKTGAEKGTQRTQAPQKGENLRIGNRNLNNHRKTSFDYDKRQGLLDKKHKRSKGNLRETINIEMVGTLEGCQPKMYSYSVCAYAEGTLLEIGMNESFLLVKISKVDLAPNPSVLKKELTLNSPKKKKDISEYSSSATPQFQKFWAQRYALFQKFDEGVQLDEGSWSKTPPQQISQFVANKCQGAKVILNGFAGVGGTSIKLSSVSSCVRVIANDYNKKKMSCLLNNAKVYEVQSNIEISQEDFLIVDKKNVDVVVAQPPPMSQALNSKCLYMLDFQPSLYQVICKCLKLSGNCLLLLPPNTSIDALCSCINKTAIELGKMKGSCSIKLEKIFFLGEFKYILVAFGSIVQKEVGLSDELEFIYGKLRRKSELVFRHKKLLKKLREDYGMMELLNFTKLSESKLKESAKNDLQLIDCFLQLIREKNLITSEKLQKLLQQPNSQLKKRPTQLQILEIKQKAKGSKSVQKSQVRQIPEVKQQPIMQQQKVQQNETNFRMSEQTQSDYSYYSYLSGLDKGDKGRASQLSRAGRLDSDSFSSVIIKRTLNGSREKRDISPNNSPHSPSRKYPKNRVTLLPQRKQPPLVSKRSKDS